MALLLPACAPPSTFTCVQSKGCCSRARSLPEVNWPVVRPGSSSGLLRGASSACGTRAHSRRSRHSVRTLAAASRDPYEVLGLPRTATPKEIKAAFRKKALKLHPDVNKAPDAAQRFAEAKAAYQTLTEPDKRAAYERGGGRSSGFGGSSTTSGYGPSSSWGSAGRYGSGFGSGTGSSAGGGGYYKQGEEYGFGQFWDDLSKEVNDWAKEREEKKRQAGGAAASASSSSSSAYGGKSLWEELADLGEELVDYLEKELGIEEEPSKPRGKYDFVDDIDKKYRTTGSSNGAGSSSSSNAQASAPPPPPPKKSRAEQVEDELAALKRKMGLK